MTLRVINIWPISLHANEPRAVQKIECAKNSMQGNVQKITNTNFSNKILPYAMLTAVC